MTSAQNRTRATAHATIGPAPSAATLTSELRELGLRPYAARVLAALLYCGSGNSAELAERSGVPRTSIYGVMEQLTDQGLVTAALTTGPAVWECRSWEEVVDALDAAEEERFRRSRDRTGRLRREMAELFHSQPSMSA